MSFTTSTVTGGYVSHGMRRAYQTSLNVRFAVEAPNANAANELAANVAANLAAWIDGSLVGSPPFAPWITAWHEDSPAPLALTPDQLWNWSPITDALEPFESPDA